MKRKKIVIALVPLLALAGMAIAGPRTGSGLLRGLSDADMERSKETGCQTSFMRGRQTLVMLLGQDFMLRTPSGLHTCRVTNHQFAHFGEASAKVTCGGLELAMRRNGRIAAHEETDSSEGRADLTVTHNRQRQVIQGSWGTAC